MNMLQIFKVGDEIEGYCGGYFGRDDYADKICVMVTKKAVVFEDEDLHLSTINVSYGDMIEFKETASKWMKVSK